jgi:hypothetical protein
MYLGSEESKRSNGALHCGVVSALRGLSLLVVTVAGIGCASTPAPVVPPPASEPAPVTRTAAPAPVYDVPAMSTFSVALLRPLGTRLSAAGDSFRAKVISPLTTLRGYPLVPVGSELQGRVVAVEQAPASRIRLKFETLTTTAGRVPLYATLTDAQPNPSFVVRQPRKAEAGYDVTLDGVPAVPVGGVGDPGTVRSHSDIRLPARTQLQLVLVHPLRVDNR